MDVNVLCDNYPESFCLLCCFSVMVVSNICVSVACSPKKAKFLPR